MQRGYNFHFILLVTSLLLSAGCSKKDSLPSASPPSNISVISSPSSIVLVEPATPMGNDTTPTLRVEGVSSGATVNLYSDSSCALLQASGVASGTSIELTLPAILDGVYNFYANTIDENGNASACSSASAAYTLMTQPPVINGLSNDLVPKKAKNWSWSCSTADSTACTYRFVVDQNPATAPSGAYGAVAAADQSSGDGTYYLHVQAIDAIGNESAVQHFSALLDNTVPSAPTSLVLKTPNTSPANITTPVVTVGGVNATETAILFSDAACSNSIGSAQAAGSTVDVTASTLSSGSYNFYARARDVAGNHSPCSSSSVAYNLDATPPSVVNILAPSNGAYSIGSSLDFQVSFNEVVAVTGTPCLQLTIGTQSKPVCYTSGSASNTLSFSYTVQSGDDDTDGIGFAGFEIALTGGAILDGVGNEANLNFAAVAPALTGVTVNTAITAPNLVTSVTQTNLTSDRKNVSFSWTAPNGNGNAVTKYIIRYKKSDATQYTFLNPDPTSPSATITNLDTDSNYDIQVAAFNGVIGPYSAPLRVSTFFNPKSLGALVWYEAKDINGTGTPVSDGTAITVLNDKSGNNNHATKISGPSATIQTEGGYKVIRLDAAGYRTAMSLGETPNTNVEIYIVAKTRQVTASFAFVNENQLNGSRFGSHFPWSDNNAYIDLPMANRVYGNWGGNITNFFAWTFRSSTTAGIALERNGVPMLSGGNRANTPPLKRWTIGSNYGGTTEYWKADMQAFFVFNKVLDTTQRAEFFRFIQTEYGVVMPQ